MKYTGYILFILILMASACSKTEPIIVGSESQVQFVGRVIPFEDCDVTTKAAKNEPKEYRIQTLDLVIFNKELKCVYYAHSPNGESVFGIDRGIDTDNDGKPDNGDFVNQDQDKLDVCWICAVANMPELYAAVEAGELGIGSENTEFLKIVTPVTGIDVPSTGMPMLGYYIGSDGNPGTIDLSVDSPVKGNTPFEVHMYALYSKIVFEMDVYSTENKTNYTPFFVLEDFEVHNVVKNVDLNGGVESRNKKNAYTEGDNDNTPLIKSGNKARIFQGAITGNNKAYDRGNGITFSFYLPERFLRPGTPVKDYQYPFREDGAIRPEDTVKCQRFKPALAQISDGDTIATFVRIRGTYSNHQAHTYTVYYDIYLGGDNFGNFDIVRNRQYNNYVTIRGINNSNDVDNNKIAYDHRVYVSRSQPFIASLRRETLLDSHFEVRPLRLRANVNDETYKRYQSNSAVKVEVLYEKKNENDVNEVTYQPASAFSTSTYWVGLERSYGDGSTESGTYCNGNNGASSAGKRKYFTTDLTFNELKSTTVKGISSSGGQVVVAPLTDASQCVWIYVDECTDASTDIEAVRTAQIKLTYGTINSETFEPYDGIYPLIYTIRQHKLYAVETTSKEDSQKRIYYIEHEEEYLHNFDSDATHQEDLTQEEGMAWGLNNIQLSDTHPAATLKQTQGNIITTILGWIGWDIGKLGSEALNNLKENPVYDFYLTRDELGVARDFKGYEFNTEIISNLKSANSDDAKVEQIALDEKPKSAIAYCYNRNKRDSDGNVEEQAWYLPAIDEIEDIMETAYLKFDDFQGKHYWSCQPAYEWREMQVEIPSRIGDAYLGADYYVDNTFRARATQALYDSNEAKFEGVISSGVPGVSGVQYATGEIEYLSKKVNITLGEYKSEGELDYTNHPGNKLRTAKARVRCIRKPSATNTNTGE